MRDLQGLAFSSLVQQDELPCLHIKHHKFFAEICLQGAQLTQFKPTQGAPLIWLSPEAEYKKGKSLRGGIPVCWPWFGNLEKNPENIQSNIQPTSLAHGFAREQLWSIQSVKESCQEVCVVLELSDNEVTHQYFPFSFRLTLELKLSERIELNLISHNLSQDAWDISQALHTYFPVNDINHCRILGTQGQTYIDALDDWKEKKQTGSVSINEEVDRLYFGESNYTIFNESQSIRVQSSSNSSVIWNPWIEKSKSLSQFKNSNYKNMLCIESANVMKDHIHLKPDAQHTLNVIIEAD